MVVRGREMKGAAAFEMTEKIYRGESFQSRRNGESRKETETQRGLSIEM